MSFLAAIQPLMVKLEGGEEGALNIPSSVFISDLCV